MKTMKVIITLVLVSAFTLLFSQETALKGKITDKGSGELIAFVNVIVSQNGEFVAGATSNMDGEYEIEGLEPGRYDINVSFVEYEDYEIQGVVLDKDQDTEQDVILRPEGFAPDVGLISN